MNTITPLQSILVTSPVNQQQGNRTASAFATGHGQTVTATVEEARPGGQFLLNFAGNRLLAKSDVALQVGETLRLNITATEPQIELKIISGSTLGQLIGKSISLVGKNISVAQLFADFAQQPAFFSDLSKTSQETLTYYNTVGQNDSADTLGGEVLKQLIDRLGLSFERLIAEGNTETASKSLKSALLELSKSFADAESLSEHTNKLLSTLELFQMAQIQLDTSRQTLYPLPLPFIENGFLLVEHDDANTSHAEHQEAPLRFSLHLTMSELGWVRVDFLQSKEGLFIRFHTGNTATADFASSFSDELKQAITAPLAAITFTADAEDPVKYLLKQLLPDGSQVLDTKV